jgi:aspartyl-tRNA(Asn)/glutamyl-tRNA(Gln) amidotransferase subunit A
VDDPLAMYLADLFTIHANLCGVPALNLPAGFTASGLPIGLQVMGRAGSEETLFRLGAALEATAGEFRPPDLARARTQVEAVSR